MHSDLEQTLSDADPAKPTTILKNDAGARLRTGSVKRSQGTKSITIVTLLPGGGFLYRFRPVQEARTFHFAILRSRKLRIRGASSSS
ncbi:hypothetical protein RLEG12_09275 (plasmid) [Rhizobium leguminosarum bv. trifolii CB782]|nr:hypothetical protein RLEG12_09275 [Rhizobium leguminosarum bv. trifolii CB782]